MMLKWGWVLHGDQDPLDINGLILQSLGKIRGKC